MLGLTEVVACVAVKNTDASLLLTVSWPAFAIHEEKLVHRTIDKALRKLKGRFGLKRFLRDGYGTIAEDRSRKYYRPAEIKVGHILLPFSFGLDIIFFELFSFEPSSGSDLPPLQRNSSIASLIFTWRLRSKIIRTAAVCCVVYNRCSQ